jgi:MOSC domain-containing protein YiiM
MKLLSLNVAQPRIVETRHGEVITSIFKEPVVGRRRIAPHNVDGDRQADLTVHGGPEKAVYGYAWDHYDYWAEALPETALSAGMFGENLTVEGLWEEALHIGDVVAIGSVRLRVTQPRMPCYKLALRFERADMVKRFWKSGRSGIYFAVEGIGEAGAGDKVEVLETHSLKVSVADVVKMYQGKAGDDSKLFERIMASPLAGGWREGIREKWTQTH